MDTVKDRVKRLCQKQGLTVQQLEKQIGISNGTIGKWDRYNPRLDTLQKVADFLSTTTDYLTGVAPEAFKDSGDQAITATGEYEVKLIETYRKLNEIGKVKVLLAALEELRDELGEPKEEEKENALLSALKIG